MSAVTLRIIADNIGLGLADDGYPYDLGSDTDGTALDLQSIHVGMDGEHSTNGVGGNEVACEHCRATHRDADTADDADKSDPFCVDAPSCTACNGDVLGDDGDECQRCEGTGCGRHVWQRPPVSWCNSLGVHVDRDKDSVTVHISVGDPRGNFAMTVRKRPDTGQLLLHVPYADMPAPHVSLREVHPGTFVLGD